MTSTSKQKTRPLVNRLVSAAIHPLTPPQKWTLVALLDHQNKKNGTKVWPHVSRLCKMTGYKNRATRQALYDLKTLGFINIDAQPGALNIYYLNLEMIEEQAGRKCLPDLPTQASNATPLGSKCQPPRHLMPDTLAFNANITGKEPVKNRVNLTGSEKSNREKGANSGFKTSREAAISVVSEIRASNVNGE